MCHIGIFIGFIIIHCLLDCRDCSPCLFNRKFAILGATTALLNGLRSAIQSYPMLIINESRCYPFSFSILLFLSPRSLTQFYTMVSGEIFKSGRQQINIHIRSLKSNTGKTWWCYYDQRLIVFLQHLDFCSSPCLAPLAAATLSLFFFILCLFFFL